MHSKLTFSYSLNHCIVLLLEFIPEFIALHNLYITVDSKTDCTNQTTFCEGTNNFDIKETFYEAVKEEDKHYNGVTEYRSSGELSVNQM